MIHPSDTIICPGCGWTGNRKDLGKNGECPNCSYESSFSRLLTIKEMLKTKLEYNDVRMDLFLRSFIESFEKR